MTPDRGYAEVRRFLERKYGNNEAVVSVFVDKIID